MKRTHVAALIATLRGLADAGGSGKAARTRIAVAALDADEVKANPTLARDLLADELAPWSVDLLGEVTRLEGDDTDASAEGMLWLDLALVRVLVRLDPELGEGARGAREIAATGDRWKLWADADTPPGLVTFAGDLWSRRVRERWRRGVDRPPAMVRAVVEPLNRLARGATLEEVRCELVDARGERIAGRKPDDSEVAAMPVEVVRRGLKAWRSTTARRVVRFFALEAHAGEVRGDLRPERLRIKGGLGGLAEGAGCGGHKARGIVRDVLNLGRWLDLSIRGGLEVHGLWTWNQHRAEAPGLARELVVNLNPDVFLSGVATDMKHTMGDGTRDARRARLLVPVLRHEVPFRIPNKAERGLVWSVADSALVVLVDRAPELVAEGGVRIDLAAWRQLVDEAGLDEARAGTVRDLLLEGDGEAPSMLRHVGGDRYTLAEVHAPELAFIVSRVDGRRRERSSRDGGGTPRAGNPHGRR